MHEDRSLIARSQSVLLREEKRPLLDATKRLRCYSLATSHCQIHRENDIPHIQSYDVQKLTTVRVFLAFSGTVLTDVILWVETILNALVFWTIFAGVMYLHWDGLEKFVGKESNIRSFIAMFTTLVGLLLSFYTSLNIRRWWDMRMLGVGGIWQASSKLTLQISQGVTRDPDVLDAIWRYAAGSLAFLFLMRRKTPDDLGMLVEQKLLTPAEMQQMMRTPAAQRAEAIWSWLGAMVSQLHEQKMISGPPQYAGLMNTVDDGRGGANVINSYLETPIPMAYIHLLGLMVKLHNVMVAMLMGILSAKHAMSGDELGAFRTMFRAFFMPFLYNSILLINDDMTDPFSGDLSDFPLLKLVQGIKEDAKAMVECGSAENLPAWLLQGKKFDKWKSEELPSQASA